MDLGGWLRSLGLEQYEATFRANAIEADVLQDLTDQDLEKLRALLGHRRRLLRAIAEHRRRTCGSNHRIVRALGVKPARGMRDGAANAIRLDDPKLEKLEGDALDQQPRTLSAKVIFFGAA
jgi:SAM domain (Sterile alpha motif)